MERRMENLKKVIPEIEVEFAITKYSCIAKNRLDALYLAYFDLKDKFCKIDRRNFGTVKQIEFEPIYSCTTTSIASSWIEPPYTTQYIYFDPLSTYYTGQIDESLCVTASTSDGLYTNNW